MNLDRLLLTAVTGFALVGLSAVGYANLDDGQERTMAYQGYLERNSVPVEGQMNLRFGLTSATGGNWDCLATSVDSGDACGLWWEPHDDVAVSQGNFSVELGDVFSLTDAVFAQNALYLKIAVEDPNSPGFTVLPGEQKLSAVAFANRGVAAKNFTVSGNLTVDGHSDFNTADVNGTLTAGRLDAYGNITAVGSIYSERSALIDQAVVVDDDANRFRIGGDYTGHVNDNNSYAEIANDTDVHEKLMLLGNRSAGTGRRRIGMWDDVLVNRSLTVNEGTNPLLFSDDWQGSTSLGSGHAEISNDTDTYNKLMIVGNRSDDGSTRKVGIWDHVDINGTLSISNDSGSWSCATRYTSCDDDGNGSVVYLDRHDVVCNNGEVLNSMVFQRCNSNNGMRWQYKCCQL